MTKFWVGGTGNWSDTAHWATSSGGAGGTAVPTSSDDVVFDSLSNATAYAVTVDATSNCRDLTVGNPLAGAITFGGSSALNVFGSLSLAAASVFTYSGTITYSSTATGKTITTNSVSMATCSQTFDGVGGGWTLQDTMTCGNITVTRGAFSTNAQTVSCGTLSSSNSNVRTVTLTNSTITLANFSVVQFSTTTNLTFTATGSTINLNISFQSPNWGNLTWGSIVITALGTGSYQLNVNSAALSCANLTLNNVNNNQALFALGANVTCSSTFTPAGFNSTTSRLLLISDTPGTQRTITAATVTASNVNLQDIVGAGAGSWNLSAITGLSGDMGGNSSITFTSNITCYFKSAASANFSAANWFTTSGGATPARVPLPQDTARFDANSFTAGSIVLTLDIAVQPTIDFTGSTNSPTYSNSAGIFATGAVTLISAMTCTGALGGGITLVARSNINITTAGKAQSGGLIVQMPGFTATQLDAIQLGYIQINRGSWTTGGFAMTFATNALPSLNVSTNGTLNLGASTLTLSAVASPFTDLSVTGTINAGTSTLVVSDTSSTQKTINLGSKTWNNITISGDNVVIQGSNTLTGTLAINTAGLTNGLVLTAGTTQTVAALTTNGFAANLAKLVSSSAGTAATISCSSLVSVDYMSIKDSTAAGYTPFYAGVNSSNVSGNTRWVFTAPPTIYVSMFNPRIVDSTRKRRNFYCEGLSIYPWRSLVVPINPDSWVPSLPDFARAKRRSTPVGWSAYSFGIATNEDPLMKWSPSYPDFARAAQPNVPVGWYYLPPEVVLPDKWVSYLPDFARGHIPNVPQGWFDYPFGIFTNEDPLEKWDPEYPDFARKRRPNVPVGWFSYPFAIVTGEVVFPDKWIPSYPDFARAAQPNVPVGVWVKPNYVPFEQIMMFSLDDLFNFFAT